MTPLNACLADCGGDYLGVLAGSITGQQAQGSSMAVDSRALESFQLALHLQPYPSLLPLSNCDSEPTRSYIYYTAVSIE